MDEQIKTAIKEYLSAEVEKLKQQAKEDDEEIEFACYEFCDRLAFVRGFLHVLYKNVSEGEIERFMSTVAEDVALDLKVCDNEAFCVH